MKSEVIEYLCGEYVEINHKLHESVDNPDVLVNEFKRLLEEKNAVANLIAKCCCDQFFFEVK